MADRYRGFADLAANAARGVDYDIVVRTHGRDRSVVVAAPHGGGIEAGSAELAARIAGGEHALYAFQGLRARDNGALHLTSARFDEPIALGLVTAAETAVTVHGCRGRRERVYVGGLNAGLASRISEALARAGFPVTHPPAGLQGRKPANLTNRARQAGVQLELSWPLRQRLLGHLTDGGAAAPPGDARWAFVSAVRRAMAAWRANSTSPRRGGLITPRGEVVTRRARGRDGVPCQPVSGSSWSAAELMQ